MKKSILLGGVFNYDIIVERVYTNGFELGKNNKYEEKIISECVGGTCGNVSCMTAYLGLDSFPIAHFDTTDKGLKLKQDLEHYGCNTRFVRNSADGGTTTLQCVHRRNKQTGAPEMTFRQGNAADPTSRFPRRKNIRLRDEVPAFLESLDFRPDVFFFDCEAAGYRALAEALRQKGTLVYYEPESAKEERQFLTGVEVSDIVKFSGEKVESTAFAEAYKDKLFIQTLGSRGLQYKLRDGEWTHIDPEPCEKVVDWEGAGDWTTSQFIACLCERDLLDIATLTDTDLRECLKIAQQTAAKSVGYMSSKGMINEKGNL